ncbi:MAG: ATP-grasp domain-containing protein, partial [Candidatus Faecivivens sp.]|nr:ATP-grasp domain-containing protein [Candidatus Faecivivens sp.]
WLETDAALRTDFNIVTGQKTSDMEKIKHKSAMKAYYQVAGIPVARYHLVDTLENGLKFVEKVGYPVVVKPDNGVGAAATYKLENEEQLRAFYAGGWATQYIMEEFIEGEICSYDSIINSDGVPLLETGNITPVSIMDLVNEKGDTFFYIVKELAPDVRAAGRACVSAFGVRSRCTHLEFFRLTKDHPALGKKGTIVGLEVNMRPSGGFTPEMINYACSTNFYRDWADMVCFDRLTLPDYPKKYFAAHYGRRKEHSYRYSHEEIMSRWGENVMESGALDPALATAMGDIFYIARFETEEEMNRWRAEMGE